MGSIVNKLLVTFIIIVTLSPIMSTPVGQPQYCPVLKESEVEGGSKVINMDNVDGRKIKLQFIYPNEKLARKLSKDSSRETTTLEADTTTIPSFKPNIFCQWDFRTANESQLLLLTFEKLSAPNSKDCSDAFVGMQKHNAFESRWCGNGNMKQQKTRPMTLFSRGSAKVSVYHKANAAMSPPTGFTVIVETVDASKVEGGGGKNALRVLLG